MTDIGFYHLRALPLERALPRLLEKAIERGHRALVLAESAERVAMLDALLWTFDPASFLPHGTAKGGDAEHQPILIAEAEDRRNGADLVVLVDGIEIADIAAYARCLDLFDGNDADAVGAARERWKRHKAAGHALTYWQQDDAGGWSKQ